MTVIRVETISDARLAAFHAVSDAELLRQRDLFVAEGRLVVERVIRERHLRLRALLVTESNYHALEGVLTTVAADVPTFICETADFAGITGFNLHRGCLALVERP